MWQNVKPACWQPDSERKIHDMFVSWLYANETHLGWNLRRVEIVLSWRAKLSLFPHCFAFCIKVFSEIMGTFLHRLQAARVGGGGCLWVRVRMSWAWNSKLHYFSREAFFPESAGSFVKGSGFWVMVPGELQQDLWSCSLFGGTALPPG